MPWCSEADRTLGGLDVLVNNAGNDDRHSLDEVTPAYWDDRMAVNLRHLFFAAQAAVPAMRRARRRRDPQFRIDQLASRTGGPVALSDRQGGDRGDDTGAGPRPGAATASGWPPIVPGNVQTPRQEKWYTPEGEAEIVARNA